MLDSADCTDRTPQHELDHTDQDVSALKDLTREVGIV